MLVLLKGQICETCHVDGFGFHGICLKFQDQFTCPKVV
jgi:hypothetical protein